MNPSTPPAARLSRRAVLAAAAAVAASAAGYLPIRSAPVAAAVVAEPRPHRTLLGVL